MADPLEAASAALNTGGQGGGSSGNPSPSSAPAAAPSPSPAPSPSTTPSSPASSAQPSSASPASPASAPASPAQGQGATPAPGTTTATNPASSEYISIRDALRGYGMNVEGYQDDHVALQQLVLQAQQARQLQEMAQYGQIYLRHAAQFQQWQQQEQENARRQQEQAQQWFKAPEWNPAWRSQIIKDPTTGELKPAPGAPPDVVQKYLNAVNHQGEFLERFAFDPVGAIRPGIEQIATQIAQQMVQQHLGGYQQQVYADSFIRENSDWLHMRDAQGKTLVNPQTGQPLLSEWGQRFRNYAHQAAQMGLRGDQALSQYAMGMVQRDFALQRMQSAQAQNQGDAAKQQLLNDGRNATAGNGQHVPNVNPAPAAGSTQAGRNNQKIPLSERLKRNLTAAGVNLNT